MSSEPRTAVLLINVGTPDEPTTAAVRRYLRQFLGDRFVIDSSALARFLLLNFVILPFRPKVSAAAYRQVWTDQGSPLLCLSEALTSKVSKRLAGRAKVGLGMRYGNPSIDDAIEQLRPFDRLVVVPLYPQYAAATYATTALAVLDWVKKQTDPGNTANVPAIEMRGDFYSHPGFVGAYAAKLKTKVAQHAPDRVLFSYHGLPERQCKRSETGPVDCDVVAPCPPIVGEMPHRMCYRAQCYESSRAIAKAAGLTTADYTVAFQSRLGNTPWIRPYTDIVFGELARSGVRRLLVISPSFVTDCLETLEELDIRGAEQWQEEVSAQDGNGADGGSQAEFVRVKCLNDDELWVDALVHMIFP